VDPVEPNLLARRHLCSNEPGGGTEFDGQVDGGVEGFDRLHVGSSIALIRTAELSAQPIPIWNQTSNVGCELRTHFRHTLGEVFLNASIASAFCL
jgi:hypothetical protein